MNGSRNCLALRACGLGLAALAACSSPRPAADVRNACLAVLDDIPRDLGERGIVAWLDWFDSDPQFFMAVSGELLLADREAAELHVRSLAAHTLAVELTFTEPRVVPHGPDVASATAAFDEVVRDDRGASQRFHGRFTCVLRRRPSGWRLANAHWSMPVPGLEHR